MPGKITKPLYAAEMKSAFLDIDVMEILSSFSFAKDIFNGNANKEPAVYKPLFFKEQFMRVADSIYKNLKAGTRQYASALAFVALGIKLKTEPIILMRTLGDTVNVAVNF